LIGQGKSEKQQLKNKSRNRPRLRMDKIQNRKSGKKFQEIMSWCRNRKSHIKMAQCLKNATKKPEDLN